MIRYWQYYVGHTIREQLHILEVGESSKTRAQKDKFSVWSMVRREGQTEFFSHHAQRLHMHPKANTMTKYWQYYVNQTTREHLHILEVGENTKTGPDSQVFGMVNGKEGRAG